MSDAAHDSLLGTLTWTDETWIGTTSRFGHSVPFSIFFDSDGPWINKEEEKQEAIHAARELMKRLTAEWERSLRATSSRQILDDSNSQSDHVTTDQDVAKLIEELLLESVTFLFGGGRIAPCLGYTSRGWFDGNRITIQCAPDLSIDDVVVHPIDGDDQTN